MTFPVTVPNTFGGQSGNISLALLDQNFAALVAGFTNTLNADNTQGPTSPLTWAQTLALSPAAGVALTLNGVSGQDVIDLNPVQAAGVGWAININATSAADLRGINIVNPNTGTAAGTVGLAIGVNSGNQFLLGKTGGNFAGAKFANGPAGEVSYVWSGGSVPLVFATGPGGGPTAWAAINPDGIHGGLVVYTPTAGPALLANALENTNAFQFQGPNTGRGWNLTFTDTTGSAARGFIGIGTATVTGAVSTDFAISPGAGGSVVIGTTNGTAIGTRFGPNGNVTMNAPTSGSTLTLNGTAGAVDLLLSPASGQIPIGLGNGGSATQFASVGSNYVSTAAATPTLSANKPGANAGVIQWLSVLANGVQGWIPVFGN